METVNIFARINKLQTTLTVQPLRQGKLQQDTINSIISIKFLNQGFKIFLSNSCINSMCSRNNSRFFTGNFLVANINLRRRIFTYKNYSKAGGSAVFFLQCVYFYF